MPKTARKEWLLIFYSVPSHPVSNRMKIWRKLAKVGAVQLKGAVYILPATEEHEEFLQWLMGEVRAMGGDGAFVRSAEIRTMDEADIQGLFIRQSEKEYTKLEKGLDVLERKFQSIRKGAKGQEPAALGVHLARIEKEFNEIARRDFFLSPAGEGIKKRIQALGTGLRASAGKTVERDRAIPARRPADYQGRTWATRKRPFVDRMASAWLIRRFIDNEASFAFIEERELAGLGDKSIAFDIRGGEFTHAGNLCTFEVLVRSFGIKDKAVRKIAEIVHDLDVKDEKYGRPEAAGVEDILAGIRKTAKDDADSLERGMAVFEMMYQSKS